MACIVMEISNPEGLFQTPLHSWANLTDELSTAEDKRLNQSGSAGSGLVRQATLNSAESVVLSNVEAVADSYGAHVMCRT